ncbi:protein lethal(2)denticleless [Culicoides brevitarsis]|uniref:protein lethal(2)denticleless n=1 Tax=Culicoides brevitarsis TaxID=469753 RepID=UPI00307C9BEE
MQNSILNLIGRQHGNYFSRNYDTTLCRLAAHETDSWKGVAPSTHGPLYNPEPPVLAAKFAKQTGNQHIIAIANEDGMVAVQNVNHRNYDIASGEIPLDGVQCHYNAVFDVEWMPNEMKLVTVSGDHSAKLWQLTESKLVETRIFQGHFRSVKTAAFRKTDSAVFATGGRDGSILIWDTRSAHSMESASRADNCIFSGHAGGQPNTPQSHRKRSGSRQSTPKLPANVSSSSITGLVFQDDNSLISCGAGDGLIKVWDMRRNYTAFKKEPMPKYSLPYAGTSTFVGFTNLLVDNAGIRLYASCMDNTIYCYNISTYTQPLVQKYTGADIGSFYIKACLSPDDKYLISGSSSEKAYIWNVDYQNPLVTLNGHTQEVTCVAWTQSRENAIVTCSDDARHKIWRIPREEITSDILALKYRGVAEPCPDYRKSTKIPVKTTFTPRSGRKFIRYERTPTTTTPFERRTNSTKRPYSTICDEDEPTNPDPKRVNTENGVISKGRRLFSPLASTSRQAGGIQCLDITKGLQIIFEENEIPTSPSTSKPRTSPLAERVNANLLLSPDMNGAVPFSPTSNLPNFVVDGEAPHLRVSSPKRKLKENVDWLTKIRKQKILSLGTSEKTSEETTSQIATTPTSKTPKRRHSGYHDSPTSHNPKTPRRSSTAETSILRFLTVTPTSRK